MFVFIGQGLHAQSYTELEPIKRCIYLNNDKHDAEVADKFAGC